MKIQHTREDMLSMDLMKVSRSERGRPQKNVTEGA